MKFSIITPCYKCAKYVRETLDSVRTQKVADWELICVDDGSPDETGKVSDDYLREHCATVTESEHVIKAIGDEDRHPDAPKRVLAGELPSGARMTVVHQQNCGVSGARNTALTLATGEWLVFLDGDDLLAPGALELVGTCLEKVPNADIVECGFANFNDGEAVSWDKGSGLIMTLDVSKTIPPDPFGGCFQRFVFRHETVSGVAYKGVSCTEEMGYMVKCFIRAKTMVKTDDVFYGYRVLAGSMSHRGVSYQLCIDYFDLVRHVTRILVESGKTVPKPVMRDLMNRWGEKQVSLISLLSRKEDRNNAWACWWEKLPNVVRYKSVCSWWQWFVLMVCGRIRSRVIAFLLCRIPHWLKTKGLHR